MRDGGASGRTVVQTAFDQSDGGASAGLAAADGVEPVDASEVRELPLEFAAAGEFVPPAPGSSRTLAEIEQLALENNPTIAQVQAMYGAAQGRHLQAGLYPNPTAGYMASEIGADGTAGQQGAFVEQEFVRGGKLELSQNIFSEEINRIGWEYEAQRTRVLTSVRQGFYDLLIAQRQVELAEQLLKTSEQGEKTADDLFKAKQGNKVDLLQARVELNNARVLLQKSENRRQAAQTRLATIVGVPEMSLVSLAGEVETDIQQLDPAAALDRILATSPQLAAAQAKVARAHAVLDRACVEPVPNLELQLSAMYDYAAKEPMAGVQLGLPLPIHNRNQGNIQAAESEVIAAHREVERVRLELQNRLASALERYRNAQAEIERFRNSILPDAKESLDLVTQGWKVGELDYLRYLTAQRTYFQINLDYLAAVRDWWLAHLEIEGALLTDGLRAPDAAPMAE